MNDLSQLPTYPDEELASLSQAALMALMICDEDRVPRNVIDECARRGDTMLEFLNTLVEDSSDWEYEPPGEWWLKLHAVMILGLIPDESAGLLLVKYMRRMSREDNDMQDWFSGYWPALFRNKPEGVLSALRALSEELTIDWYIRVQAIETCIAVAQQQGTDKLEPSLEWLAGIVTDEDENWDLRLCSGNTLLNFPRIQYRLLLEDMAAQQGAIGAHFCQNDVELVYAVMQDQPDWDRFSNPWEFYTPEAITARQQRWADEKTKYEVIEGDDELDEDYNFLSNKFPEEMFPFDEPYIRPEPKVGRNDPCPCGSGKKYKKCCLNKDEGMTDIF